MTSIKDQTQHNKNKELSFRERFTRTWCVISVSVIMLWTLWTLLDAFVIPSEIVKTDAETSENADEEMSAEEAAEALLTDPVITDTSYNNGKVQIELQYMRTLYTDVYIADIRLSDPSYLCTALAEDSFGRNLVDLTSNMAEDNDAILAINGDYYGFRSFGYVMRNGFLYRSRPGKDPKQEDLVFYKDGSVEIVREADVTAQKLADNGAEDIFSFGPGLVADGEITVNYGDEVERAQVTNPRTAFGVISPLHFLFVVSDGRTDESVGLSLLELAQLMKELGCSTAYNLDGGGSSTIWFNGKVLNQPTTYGDTIAERSISDIIYISK